MLTCKHYTVLKTFLDFSVFQMITNLDASKWNLVPLSIARKRLLARDTFTADACDVTKNSSTPVVAAAPSKLISSCSKCPNFRYISTEAFREHCKTDWHLYNLRNPCLSFEDWSLLDEFSSSGDSCVSSDDEDILCSNISPCYLFFGVRWKFVDSVGILDIIPSLPVLLDAKFVSILLFRSGRFAGAIWDSEGNVLVHSCVKRYTVRRKNGGSQSVHDAKGSPANSVGAQIRRAQERKLDQDVCQLISVQWKEYFESSKSLVFAYASKSLTESLFVGPLTRATRKCTVLPVPISMHDPTYGEVCRIHKIFSSVLFPKSV